MPSRPRTDRTHPRAGRAEPPAALRPEELASRAAAGLADFLPGQRWFGAKTRAIRHAAALDEAAVPGSDGILALFTVTYAEGPPETYCVPVRPAPAAPGFADATEDAGFGGGLADQIRLAATLPGRHGRFRFTRTALLDEVLPPRPVRIARFRGEQSNTSVAYDQAAILKLYRRLEAGPNPEFEIGESLARHTSFQGSPRLLGAIAYEPGGGAEATTVGVLQEFVPNRGDAWTATLARLAEYYAAAGGFTEGGAPDAAFARASAAADAKEAAALGELTGRLHVALASAPPGSPLAPEPIEAADLAAWQAGMEARLARATRALEAGVDAWPAAVQAVVRQALADAPRLRGRLAALQALAIGTVSKIRVHGDYHLGQVLEADRGFCILDFEGEPARTLAERRAKQCALKDVAGMLRSYAYAAHVGLRRALESAPACEDLAARLAPWAESWEDGVRTAFLDAYLAETLGRGAAFLPRQREPLEAALRAYELDKAIYELEYELNHRPGWLPVPLEGWRRAVAGAPRPAPPQLRSGEGAFGFVACLELREFVGVRAENERQLAELIEEVPLDSIYYHTHSFFLRHKFVAGTYPNDFATWVAVQVRDQALGERLAMVDPAGFADLQALREELASVVDEHLRSLPIVPQVIFGEPFDFIQSRIVEIPTGIQARTLQEFRDALLEVDLSALYFHLVEARMRLGRGRNDFAAWLENGLGLPDLAARVQAVDPHAGSLERTRARLIALCDEALAA
jgi:trehalose synthase-fused probable maltokinase